MTDTPENRKPLCTKEAKTAPRKANKPKRLSLRQLEHADECKRLLDGGWSVRQIALHMKCSKVHITNQLMLAGAPAQVREMVALEVITISAAHKALRVHGDKAGERIAQGMSMAAAQGKRRITPSMLLDARAEGDTQPKGALYEAVRKLRNEQAFQQLPATLQHEIESLIARGEPVAASVVGIESAPELALQASAPQDVATRLAPQGSAEPSAPKKRRSSSAGRAKLKVEGDPSAPEVANGGTNEQAKMPSAESTPVDAPTQTQLLDTEEHSEEGAAVVEAEAEVEAEPGLDGIDIEEFLTHPHWQRLDEELHRLVDHVPQTSQRCERTTILSWLYQREGVSTFTMLADRIKGIESPIMRKRAMRRTLRTMERLKLVSLVTFPESDDQADNQREEELGRNSMITLTWTGMVWMRRAWQARANLARNKYTILQAHEMLVEEEEEGRGDEAVWVEGLSGVSPEEAKTNVRAITAGRGHITSVFDLGLKR
ncbi:hypothetical protein [Hydrogenophaga sp. PML113]|uniref:hypothetical protein n=1 Tax=Hydrogenophaga sp. PML113 TaxID=1899350 RepID=UPI0008787338|nr:hypothetical protein [Hydrogenophaga sp. PML113]